MIVKTLKEHLKSLRDGRGLVLAESDRYSVEHELIFEDGAWYERQRTCWNDCCACNSHDTYSLDRVDRDRALRLIRSVIDRDETDARQRAEEIAWIDASIESLRDTAALPGTLWRGP